MTGRAIQGNIQFKGGSIGPTQGGTIHNLRTEYSPVLPECVKVFLLCPLFGVSFIRGSTVY